jgi:hypothetical protein
MKQRLFFCRLKNPFDSPRFSLSVLNNRIDRQVRSQKLRHRALESAASDKPVPFPNSAISRIGLQPLGCPGTSLAFSVIPTLLVLDKQHSCLAYTLLPGEFAPGEQKTRKEVVPGDETRQQPVFATACSQVRNQTGNNLLHIYLFRRRRINA